MTSTKNYYTSSNYAGKIPTREEFHRYASNVISNSDFDTSYPNGIQIDKVASSINWTIKNSKKKPDYKFKKGTK